MRQDFTALQDIEEPSEIKMISGPISYSKYSIRDNDVLKEIEIFGDRHNSEANNCTEQGESCIYVSKSGIVHDETNNVHCVDIPTYLGYAILDAHKNYKYTDIYIESLHQESGRMYNIRRESPIWDMGYIIKTEIFLQPCGTNVNKSSLCRDSPNGERNWSRVHSGDIRSDTLSREMHEALEESLQIETIKKKGERQRILTMLTFLRNVTGKVLKAFLEPDFSSSIRDIFLPFYNMIYPIKHDDEKEDQNDEIETYYPFIYILMTEFGDYNKNYMKRKPIIKRGIKGSLILERTTNTGKKILLHRVGKTYSKILNIKSQYEKHELPYIMISAYEKFVSSIEYGANELLEEIINQIKEVNVDTTWPQLKSIKDKSSLMITKLFAPLYEIYSIGRMISYPESERMIYYSGDLHSKGLIKYLTQFLKPELQEANVLFSNINYSINADIDIKHNYGERINRCMRL